jgi:hypothetical protein
MPMLDYKSWKIKPFRRWSLSKLQVFTPPLLILTYLGVSRLAEGAKTNDIVAVNPSRGFCFHSTIPCSASAERSMWETRA